MKETSQHYITSNAGHRVWCACRNTEGISVSSSATLSSDIFAETTGKSCNTTGLF